MPLAHSARILQLTSDSPKSQPGDPRVWGAGGYHHPDILMGDRTNVLREMRPSTFFSFVCCLYICCMTLSYSFHRGAQGHPHPTSVLTLVGGLCDIRTPSDQGPLGVSQEPYGVPWGTPVGS